MRGVASPFPHTSWRDTSLRTGIILPLLSTGLRTSKLKVNVAMVSE
jgi:hypothetical protein